LSACSAGRGLCQRLALVIGETVVLLSIAASPAPAGSIPVHLEGPEDNAVCLGCHDDPNLRKTLGDGRVISLYVDGKMFAGTVHAGRTCTDCHTDIEQIPHRHQIQKVNCGRCHYVDEIQGAKMPRKPTHYKESVHGRHLPAGSTDVPVCTDCHGEHSIHIALDLRSKYRNRMSD